MLRLLTLLSLSAATSALAQAPSADQLAFFETKVRPLLTQRCFKCHGPSKQKSKLRLDHIEHVRKGGERGPAIDAAHPAKSRILHAISYADSELQMPPKSRLAASEIDTLRRWITMGAPWPNEPLPEAATHSNRRVFDLQQRKRDHWAWHPLRDEAPPTIDEPLWRGNPIDRFVLTKLRENGLRPAPEAARATWLRRVTFGLIGLPPTVTELDAFRATTGAEAYCDVVDRLLASPHFGEHWARHWLDLVRFAETMGHEFDYAIPNAWRYRDYVIRALNLDVPYDQFVREQVAGDLLENPRLHPQDGFNESIIGTGFYWFVEQVHSPVDVRKHTSDRTDNQIDVLTKTFLGLTVGCARCHDHKFDAISTEDYYSLSGYLKSSRYMQRDVRPDINKEAARDFQKASRALTTAWAAHIQSIATEVKTQFRIAARRRLAKPGADNADGDVATEHLKLWETALADKQIDRDVLHPMHGFAQFVREFGRQFDQKKGGNAKGGEGDVRTAWLRATEGARRAADEFAKSGPATFIDFRKDYYTTWFKEGAAFGTGPVLGATMIHGDWLPTAIHTGGWASSSAYGLRAQGVLHSPRFKIEKRYIHILAHGRESRIKVVLEGFHVIRAPIYGALKQVVNSTTPRWYTIDLEMWLGKRACIILCDQETRDLGDGKRYRKDGYLAVRQIVFADKNRPPNPHAHMVDSVFGAGGDPIRTLDQVVDSYAQAITRAAAALTTGAITSEQARLLNWLWEKKLLGDDSEIRALRKEVLAASARIHGGVHVPAMAEGTGEDENIFLRGGHNSLGAVAPRRFLTAIAGVDQRELDATSSGRRELAAAILAPTNPFVSRVAVNRMWHHLFGRGLVETVDNLGVQGKPPSHPKMLDWLARQFVRDGWSIKKSLRRMVLSRTYRMSSTGYPAADEQDPEVLMLHRMRVRRLTGESIRDAILQTSGRLDRTLFGRSVPINLTKFMSGRGRPGSGPLDGAGRRSIYLRISRNFLSPFLLAFDFPLPTSTMGRRAVTNVPAQALAMMNDPFVREQAKVWAAATAMGAQATGTGSPDARIRAMYRKAFARDVRPDEQTKVLAFLNKQATAYRCDLEDPRPWQDLCHAMWSVKEFIFVR